MICAPAFNHKIGNAAHFRASAVLFFMQVEESAMKEMDIGKAIPRDDVLLKI